MRLKVGLVGDCSSNRMGDAAHAVEGKKEERLKKKETQYTSSLSLFFAAIKVHCFTHTRYDEKYIKYHTKKTLNYHDGT